MKQKIFNFLLSFLSQISHKKVFYINNQYINYKNLAIKSRYDFWYCGNVFDQTDIAYGVASNGTIEQEDTEVVKKILEHIKSDYVFYDIGANTGWYSALAASLSKESVVFSFEPVREHVECLEQTIELNKFGERIKVYTLALSDKQGESEISLAGTGSTLEKDFLEKNNNLRKVQLTTADYLLQEGKILSPDFIKIDVEGHEYKVLLGSKKVISENMPVLFIEIAYTLKKINRGFVNANYIETFTLLKDLGYEAYIISHKKILKYNPEQRLDGTQMFLFLNKNKHSNIVTILTK